MRRRRGPAPSIRTPGPSPQRGQNRNDSAGRIAGPPGGKTRRRHRSARAGCGRRSRPLRHHERKGRARPPAVPVGGWYDRRDHGRRRQRGRGLRVLRGADEGPLRELPGRPLRAEGEAPLRLRALRLRTHGRRLRRRADLRGHAASRSSTTGRRSSTPPTAARPRARSSSRSARRCGASRSRSSCCSTCSPPSARTS